MAEKPLPKYPLVDEFIADDLPPAYDAQFTPRNRLGFPISKIYYAPKAAHNPTVRNHERIHAYQTWLARTTGAPPPTNSALKSNILTTPSPAHLPSYGEDGIEIPAWAFEGDSPSDQPNFNRYVDENYTRSKGRSSPVETLLPPNLHREYVKSHPRPLVPTDPIEETESKLSFWNKLARSLGVK